MRYTGENCPYCGTEFAEQDDVVVCPDCGTPHHRVCWFAHGECAAAEKHAEGFVWKKSAEPQPEQEESKTEKNAHTRSESNLDIVCPDCGATCPNGTLRCPECGAVLIPFANPMGDPPIAQFKPDFNPNENIRGLKSGDIALFCRTAGASYIKKFRRKFSWNWAAFLFSPYWFFYRKLHKAGAILFAVFISLNLLMIPAEQYFNDTTAPIMAEMYELIEPYVEENQQTGFMSFLYGNSVTVSEEGYKVLEEFIQSNQSRIINEVLKPLLPIVAVLFLLGSLKVVSALLADRLYYKKACTEIKRIRGSSSDERKVQVELFRKGGTNILFGSGSYLIGDILIYAASYLLMR
ncbi:MAG: DUF2628 domain-containing protein [Clostridia bacterium]|nr:DUF2628 domain-containing protein [Clostridia bacterium]